MKIRFAAFFIMAAMALCAQETTNTTIDKWSAGRPDGHAPISVMGDHMHNQGEWMFSYRYMFMNMADLKRENDDVSFDNALVDYMVTPTEMPMQMHMLGGMYAPSDAITIMVMANYVNMTMDHLTRMGGTFTTEVSGLGDVSVSGLFRLFNRNKSTMHGQFGVSIPTGGVTEMDVIPASAPNSVVLPYPMQLGSGTFDANLAMTYLCQSELLSYGAQVRGVVRLGKNERDFRYGNRLGLNNWLGLKVANWLSFSARLEGLLEGKINDVDPTLNPDMVITADTENSGGTYLNSGLGFNLYAPNGALKNLRLGFEFAYPLYQNLNGVQLKNEETLTLGLQYSL